MIAKLNGWMETTIGEQVTLQRGHDITKAQQQIGSVPVISSGGISSYHDKAMARGPGVVLGRKGVVGSVYYTGVDYWPHDTTLWVKNFHGNNPRFVYYFFKALAPHISRMDVGSANPTLNRNHVHPIKVKWPSQTEQIQIAQVLGALDDKIQINWRSNETLEAIARAIFKSWFVDFDPVRAKMEDRPYPLAKEILDLFPDSFQDSPLGEIPKGWEIKAISDLARFINGKNFTKDATGTGRMVIRIAELNSGPGPSTVYNEINAEPENIAYPNDLLFSWSGSLDVYRWHRDGALVNQHIFKVACDRFPEWFVYQQLKEVMPFFQAVASDKATTMGHIKRGHLSQAEFASPSEPLLHAVGRTMKPIFDKVHTNDRESLRLAATRDALLPKLMSGELTLAQK